jgi:tRNA (guanine37-N1)-methyltransferase
MVLAVKVRTMDAEKTKDFLIRKGIFSKDYVVKREGEFIFFPIAKKAKLNIKDAEIVNVDIEEIQKEKTLNTILEKKLTKKQLSLLPCAYDMVGDIIIVEIKDELKGKEKLIGNALLELHKNAKVIAAKSGIHEGEFRTRKLKVIAGENRKETIYKENGVQMKLDVEKVYFSERLGNERMRIAKQVKPGESVLIMFSGCAPYPMVIAKNSSAKEIVGIEKNPAAHKYGLENIKLNHTTNVTLIKGDVKKVVKTLNKKFDRIAMPLPKSAEDFLDSALLVSKKGTIIHFYDFLHETEFPELAINKIKSKIPHFKIINAVKCGQYSPGKFRVCIDFLIE